MSSKPTEWPYPHHGRVPDPAEKDSWTEAIRTYNQKLAEDEDMHTVIVPLRDGVSISVKRS